jgi:hypothetical protein
MRHRLTVLGEQSVSRVMMSVREMDPSATFPQLVWLSKVDSRDCTSGCHLPTQPKLALCLRCKNKIQMLCSIQDPVHSAASRFSKTYSCVMESLPLNRWGITMLALLLLVVLSSNTVCSYNITSVSSNFPATTGSSVIFLLGVGGGLCSPNLVYSTIDNICHRNHGSIQFGIESRQLSSPKNVVDQ